jgi:hypothetical protein
VFLLKYQRGKFCCHCAKVVKKPWVVDDSEVFCSVTCGKEYYSSDEWGQMKADGLILRLELTD